MAEAAKTGVEFQFEGLFSNLSNPKPGQAQVQVNCLSDRLGQLVTRPGLQELSFDTGVGT